MKLTALIVACLAAVALTSPVPQNRYIIRRPDNSVNLHSAARQLSAGGQTFTVRLDDDDFDSRENLLNLQGVGNFATSQVGVASTHSGQQQQAGQNVNVGGTAQFRVQVDDDDLDSHESDEDFLTTTPCPAGQLRHGSRCVIPKINRNIFVFGRDDEDLNESKQIDQAQIPLPTLDYNIIFVRSRPAQARSPVIVPPPQKKTVVYVLEDEVEGEGVIPAPVFPDADPEVYYVKVRDGENPQLPGGLDLQTAYSQAIRPLQGDESFESSIELTLGPAGAGAAGAGGAGGAAFNSALVGGVGVPLSATHPQDNSFNGGGAGFDSQLGGQVGVPLPSFQGNTDFGITGGQGRSASNDQAFAATSQRAAGRNFDVEIDDGRIEIEPSSQEAVKQALRYHVPQQG